MKYRQEITQQSEILLFGKFKHKTIQHVLRTEPGYILWLHENKIVKFPKDIVDLAEDKVDDNAPFGIDYSELHYGDR